MWCSNSSLHRKKLWVLSTLLSISHCAWGGVYGEIVSQPLLPPSVCFFFFFHMMCSHCSASFYFFSPEEIVPYVAVDLVCPLEEVSWESFYFSCVAILNWNSVFLGMEGSVCVTKYQLMDIWLDSNFWNKVPRNVGVQFFWVNISFHFSGLNAHECSIWVIGVIRSFMFRV